MVVSEEMWGASVKEVGVDVGGLAIMGGLVWDDVGGQVTSPLIGLHSICQ